MAMEGGTRCSLKQISATYFKVERFFPIRASFAPAGDSRFPHLILQFQLLERFRDPTSSLEAAIEKWRPPTKARGGHPLTPIRILELSHPTMTFFHSLEHWDLAS